MPIFRPRKFTIFPFLILFKRIESIDMTPCVISFLVYVFLIQFYKFVLFLKSITKLVKHCNKNDKIKACVVELETAFSREN